MTNNRVNNSRGPKPAPVKEAWINEPSVRECHANARWRVRLLKLQKTGKHEIEIGFFTRSNQPRTLLVDNARRSEYDWIRRELDSRSARLPHDKSGANAFVADLVRVVPESPITACASPGFCGRATGFVMPYKCYGIATGKFVWDTQNAPERAFGAIKGDLRTYQRTVLRVAEASPFASLAVLISLAGPLIDYVAKRREVRLLTETAIFHFAADTSSGKTTLARIAQSVFGEPDIAVDYEASDRGIAEAAYARNNLALVIDDAENAGDSDEETLATMLRHGRHFPRGRTKAISSRSKRADLPDLRWSCFAISSGPETVAALATRSRRDRRGDRVRIFDIKVPSREESGIFGSAVTASRERAGDSAELIKRLEDWLPKCHGVLFDAWIQYLLDNDVADRIIELADHFVDAVASGADGLERRFAKKFAILYAAGRVGVESGLLPWPKDWPMRAVRHCYENSVAQRDPDRAAATKAVRRLARSLTSRTLFPRFIAERGRHPQWGDKQIGLRRTRRGKSETFLAKDRLHLVGDPDSFGHLDVFKRLLELKVIRDGNYAAASEQLRVRVPGGEIVRVRLWRVDAAALVRWANFGGPARGNLDGDTARRQQPRRVANRPALEAVTRRAAARRR